MPASAAADGVTPVEYMLPSFAMRTHRQTNGHGPRRSRRPIAPIARCIEIELPDTSTVEGIVQALSVIPGRARVALLRADFAY